ncbi:2-amino-4-hydroxy-6-hydroxymethyldihydropteridine diphosphokinase [Spiribacter vilamensis]|uniref:2-amino-4-hydroxy-6-hydroxymethyldihydropteridine diphosphokinase n=1 Tax=Spiribacter vilamensis TaxID=531306 RepID=A0A4Q8D230_9GAMM|nr:2-amino-4-hydroxy-6-hydroxymethyldihydropteridine diphosphokinase [Spiribacter vilamensis]RZU99429.1 2-amino-4-hydroxy-6-hydroxymethyldihydropteridine diphosphokinase [Spiribacter vilamensis]TVO61598.1 2-amino-4-hydroxy-6-hydroxymethyldihydropteridine diphosphokinase [Spiribacter vilamensis]
MNRAYLSIGSNIEPERHVRAAITALHERFGELTVSPVYQTTAVGFDGDDFYNLVVGLDTDIAADQLAAACREIETEQGRQRTDRRYNARTLDIDLLTLGYMIRDDVPILPREEILKYAFVLKPLVDIAPDERHPLDGRRYADIWASFEDDYGVVPTGIDLSVESGG